jgi:hypothetical protein
VFSSAGGPQYGLGTTPTDDLLIVYAEAFVRDADPTDFSLEALVAHERGHQLLWRHSRLRRMLAARLTPVTEEILSSLLGSVIAGDPADREALVLKALAEAVRRGMAPKRAVVVVDELRRCLEEAL